MSTYASWPGTVSGVAPVATERVGLTWDGALLLSLTLSAGGESGELTVVGSLALGPFAHL